MVQIHHTRSELAGGMRRPGENVSKGFYMRGGREMDNRFECMWGYVQERSIH